MCKLIIYIFIGYIMDIYFDLKKFASESIHACIAACGKVDRLIEKFNDVDLPDENILKLNAGISGDTQPESRDAMIAKGTFEWLRDILQDPASFSLSNTSVKTLHRKIFKYSSRDDGTRGHYRTDLNDELNELFDQTKKALLSDDHHPLFVISLFRVSFINMMPFVTGNAQMANILSYVLLINSGYPFVSQLPLIASLKNTAGNVSREALPLLARNLFSLLSSHRPNAPDLEPPNSQTYLNSRRQNLLNCISKNAPLKISDIMGFFPGINRNTLKKDLLFLRAGKFISARGEGRGMVYFFSRDH
jgi:hypothetical protein